MTETEAIVVIMTAPTREEAVEAAAKPSKVLKSKVSKSMALHIYRRAAAVAVKAATRQQAASSRQ